MRDIPFETKASMRLLSFGPIEGSMVRWTYHDGSTWAVLLYDNDVLIGWACITKQEEPHPVIGVYIANTRRGSGYAKLLVSAMLSIYSNEIDSVVYAVAENWPKYVEVIEQAGFTHREWE